MYIIPHVEYVIYLVANYLLQGGPLRGGSISRQRSLAQFFFFFSCHIYEVLNPSIAIAIFVEEEAKDASLISDEILSQPVRPLHAAFSAVAMERWMGSELSIHI